MDGQKTVRWTIIHWNENGQKTVRWAVINWDENGQKTVWWTIINWDENGKKNVAWLEQLILYIPVAGFFLYLFLGSRNMFSSQIGFLAGDLRMWT